MWPEEGTTFLLRSASSEVGKVSVSSRRARPTLSISPHRISCNCDPLHSCTSNESGVEFRVLESGFLPGKGP